MIGCVPCSEAHDTSQRVLLECCSDRQLDQNPLPTARGSWRIIGGLDVVLLPPPHVRWPGPTWGETGINTLARGLPVHATVGPTTFVFVARNKKGKNEMETKWQ